MFKCLFLLSLVLLFSDTFAENAQSLFNQTLHQGEGLKRESYNKIKDFNPTAVFEHYTSDPPEIHYYNKETLSDKDHLKQDGVSHKSEVGNTVINSIQQHPKIETRDNTSPIKKSSPLFNEPNTSSLDVGSADPTYTPSPDFFRGMSALSAAKEASKNVEPGTNLIFKGHAEQCRDDAGNFSDCCNKTGWGQDWHLAHCSNEEKLLGVNRANGLTIYVGRYCSRYFSWPFNKRCREHKETWCVFNSKLARVIQQEGRSGQLGMGFGEAKYPNCNGLTPQQLQRLNFSIIDFHDFYADLERQRVTPDLNQVQKMIQQHIQEDVLAGKAHG